MKKLFLGIAVVIAFILLARVVEGPTLFDPLVNYVENGQIATLPSSFSQEEIQTRHLSLTGKKADRIELRFVPLFLLQVKFLTPSQETREGRLLFNQGTGEALLSIDEYQESRGFQDLLLAHLTIDEAALFFALQKSEGKASDESLKKNLSENFAFDKTVLSLEKKGLLVKRGPYYKIHINAPLFPALPLTFGDLHIVLRPYKYALLLPKRFSEKEIQALLSAAYSEGFSIKEVKSLYLPIFITEEDHPDGTESRYYWHGITGKRVALYTDFL